MKKLMSALLILVSFTLLSAQEKTNLLGDKGKFEGTLTGKGWTLEVQPGAEAELSLDSTAEVAKEGKSCGKIVVKKVTSENWHVQLKDPNWTAKKGYKYTFTMWAKADSIRQAQISVYGAPGDRNAYRTSTRITLTEEWQQFSQVFISDVEGSNSPLNFAFVIGFEVGIYYIDDVVITEEESGSNFYANGGFEAGTAQWNLYVNSGKATMSIVSEGAKEGSKFCRIEVTEAPKENWEIQLQDGSWKAKIGCIYIFSFWAKADAERTIHVAAQAGGSRNYNYLYGIDIGITTEWEEYSLTYVNDSLEGNDSLNFFIYCGASVGKYDFDDISLVVHSCDTPTTVKYIREKSVSFSKEPIEIANMGNSLLCKFNASIPTTLKIYDMKGRVLATYNVTTNRVINLKRPPKGMWFVEATGYKPKAIIVH